MCLDGVTDSTVHLFTMKIVTFVHTDHPISMLILVLSAPVPLYPSSRISWYSADVTGTLRLPTRLKIGGKAVPAANLSSENFSGSMLEHHQVFFQGNHTARQWALDSTASLTTNHINHLVIVCHIAYIFTGTKHPDW